MFLRLTDLSGDLVLINVQQVRFINLKRFMKKVFTCIHLEDNNWLGGTYNIYVQETISEVSLQLCELETNLSRVRLSDGEKENKEKQN